MSRSIQIVRVVIFIIFFYYRFANIPDIIELDHLTVSGDVTFGRGVSLRVIIITYFNIAANIKTNTILILSYLSHLFTF